MGEREGKVTLRTIADAAGVSPSLVSFALNGRSGVSAERRAHILRIAAEYGYAPDPLARELRTGNSLLYGLIVRNIANPFFNDLLAGMQEVAFEHGITVVATDSSYSRERERRQLALLASRKASGLAIAPVGSADNIAEWTAARPLARTVVINSSAGVAPGVDHVAPDVQAGVTLAYEHLRALGHVRIGLLTPPVGLVADDDRNAVYAELCRRDGIEQIVLHTELDRGGIVERVRRAIDGPERVTAVVTHSDYSAQYVYVAVRESGLDVGADVSVVGHDDLDSSALLDPSLTTVALDRRALGRAAFARLHGDASGDFAAPVELVVRASTGPVRPR